jgi:hypothetical protein
MIGYAMMSSGNRQLSFHIENEVHFYKLRNLNKSIDSGKIILPPRAREKAAGVPTAFFRNH